MYNRRLYKRMMSAVLAIAVLLCGMLVWSAAAEGSALKITADGQEISALTLYSYEKIELSADGVDGEVDYQWQIAHPEDENRWVNIYDATEQTISVTKALVQNVLDDNDSTRLRCLATTTEGEVCSDAVTVTLVEEIAAANSGIMLLAEDDETDTDTDSGTTTNPEFVTVTIEYIRYDYVLQDDGVTFAEEKIGTAFTSYVATLQYSSSLNTKIHCPTIVGYTPKLTLITEGGEETQPTDLDFDEDTLEVVINQTNVTSDIVYQVEYHPALVKYEVRYFFQNIYDDLYLEDADLVEQTLGVDYPVEAQGYTGTHPNTNYTQAEFTGFTSLYYEPETIAADGSTVFHVYYERDYCLMEFDCDGGYGTDTVYVRQGTYISVPNPVRSGWNFAGWDLVRASGNLDDDATDEDKKDTIRDLTIVDVDGTVTAYITDLIEWDTNGNIITYNGVDIADIAAEYVIEFSDQRADSLPSTMPGYNTAYKALWTKADTTFTVVYWVQNANNDAYSYAHSISGVNAQTGDVLTLESVVKHTYTSSDGSTVNVSTDLPTDSTLKAYSTIINDFDDAGSVTEAYKTDYQSGNGEGVVVEGDHSTVFNIYYKRNEYTLWFIYARTVTDSNGGLKCQVGFWNADYAGDWSNDSHWIDISIGPPTVTLPEGYGGSAATFTDTVEDTDGITTYTYYYFSYTARYMQDTSELWPITEAVSETSLISNLQTGSDNSTDYICHGWRVDKNSTYGKNTNVVNMISGLYDVMDNEILVNASKTSEQGANHVLLGGWASRSASPIIKSEYYVGITANEYQYDKDHLGDSFDADNYMVNSADNLNGDTSFYDYHSYWAYWKLVKTSEFYGYSGHSNYPPRSTFEGLSYSGRKEVASKYVRTFYFYHEHTLVFNNYGALKEYAPDSAGWDGQNDGKDHGDYQYNQYEATRNYYVVYESANGVDYGTDLKSHIDANAEPTYPSALEPGAYEFDGWYTGPNGSGYKVVIDDTYDYDDDGTVDTNHYDTANKIWYNPTMPDDDLILFAYWTPVIHDVYFYYDYEDYISAITASENNKRDYYWYYKDDEGVWHPDKYPIEVTHGDLLSTAYSAIPLANEGYTFVGWFYIDDTGKKRFAPDTMEVKQDLHLFAEWQSGIDTQYKVSYVLDAETTIGDTTYPAGHVIANATTGHLTAGKTKTFTAKVGAELLDDFQNASLFPTINSHSILMQQLTEDATDDDPQPNVHTFTYVYDEYVWYRVRYLDKITGLELHEEKVTKSSNAIVTEKFIPIDGYVPDNYYIRKVLASDGNDGSETNISELNEIIFYYTPDTTHGIYVIEYYTPVLGASDTDLYNEVEQDGNTVLVPKLMIDIKNSDGEIIETTQNPYWTLEQSVIGTADLYESDGVTSKTITETVDPDKFEGFTHKASTVTTYDESGNATVKAYDSKDTSVSGAVSQSGLEIRIFYERKDYPYTIQYVEYGTGTVLKEEVHKDDEAAPYESTVNHTADDSTEVDGVTYLFCPTTEKPQTQTWTIRASEPENVLTFYYQAKTVTVKYEAVCFTVDATDFGGVSLNQEAAATSAGLSGSNAIPGEGYYFVGWFSDAACTPESAVSGDWRYTPGVDNAADVQNDNGTKLKPGTLGDGDEVTYYALFAPITADLTLTKELSDGSTPTDNFIFHIVGQGKLSFVDLYVTINGAGSVTIKELPVGTYTITEETGWSWTYAVENADKDKEVKLSKQTVDGVETTTVIVDGTEATAVIFANSPESVDWLHGEASAENQFTINETSNET